MESALGARCGASEGANGQTRAICPLPLHLWQIARFHLGENIIGNVATGEVEEVPVRGNASG
jgi:hypothetical protein